MCFFSTPKIPPPPVPASFQPAQTPKDLTQGKSAKDMIRRRGLFASIYAGSNAGAPMTTGTTGGSTGA